jgi:hypothetical protein
MNLNAITKGYAVPQEEFEASIHSVFRSAINLKFENRWDLLTIVASRETDLPQGIRVDTPLDFTFEDLLINERVTCRSGILHFEKSALMIDLRKAELWECNLTALQFETKNTKARNAWRVAWNLLNECQLTSASEVVAENLLHPQDNNRSVLLHRMAEGIEALLGTASSYDRQVSPAVSSLIGLGSGLTPAGDDILVGFITGLKCCMGNDINRTEYISNLARTLIAHSHKTTTVSRTYLYHAAHGQVSRNLAELAEAISKGWSSQQVIERTSTAMTAGHTSGMDTVTGLLFGLAAWEGKLPC